MTETLPKHLASLVERHPGIDRELVDDAAAAYERLKEAFDGSLPEPADPIAVGDGFIVVWSNDEHHLSILYQPHAAPYAYYSHGLSGHKWGSRLSYDSVMDRIVRYAARLERADVDA